jgi:hypothetical protein
MAAARKRPGEGAGKGRAARLGAGRKGRRRPPKSYKFDAHKRAAFLDKLRAGLRRGAAAEAVGVHRSTVCDAMRDDPGFAAAVSEAELDACEPVEDALFKAATLDRNVTAIQVYLYNRRPDRWKDMRQAGKTYGLEALLAQLPADFGREVRAALSRTLPAGPDPAGGAAGPPATGA